MKVDKNAIIRIDYDADDLPPAAKEYKPVLFREGNLICCLLGSDPRSGIFGCGATLSEAIKDWDADLKRHMAKQVDIAALLKS
ncbi:MAG: hypothetical protein J0H74_20610 [Chitinophagaceae bacterium]|nr:hypothetical protein [Chitinophagaceae bacterium]